jgi:hypothetical protein
MGMVTIELLRRAMEARTLGGGSDRLCCGIGDLCEKALVPGNEMVPAVVLLGIGEPGFAERPSQCRISDEHVERSFELGEAPVGNPAATAPDLTDQDVAGPLHQSGFAMSPGFGQRH